MGICISRSKRVSPRGSSCSTDIVPITQCAKLEIRLVGYRCCVVDYVVYQRNRINRDRPRVEGGFQERTGSQYAPDQDVRHDGRLHTQRYEAPHTNIAVYNHRRSSLKWWHDRSSIVYLTLQVPRMINRLAFTLITID